jgi:cytochrome c5
MSAAGKIHSVRQLVISACCLVSVVALGATVSPGPAQAGNEFGQQRWPYGDLDGARIFLTYCAGCHGFEGLASYPPAPSFSRGDRLHKNDNTLLQSVLQGKNAMPSWQNKLPLPMLRPPIDYLRTMNARRRAGLAPRTQPIPPVYFKFRPIGSTDSYLWYFSRQ